MSSSQLKMPPLPPSHSRKPPTLSVATAPSSRGRISIPHELKNRFLSSQYSIQQPFFQITEEGYDIQSSCGKEVYRAVRPRHIFRNLFARIIGISAMFFVLVGGSFFAAILGNKIFGEKSNAGLGLMGFGMILSFCLGLAAYIFLSKLIAPKRRATLSSQDGQVVLQIEPTSSIFLFNSEYMIQDHQGKLLATFKKSYLGSLFRTNWHCHDAGGNYMFSALEDSLFLGILRRYVNLAQFIPLTFNFEKQGGKPFGQFVRRYSLRDKYKLDFNPNTTDAWLMVATSILLDTGETR